MSAIVPRQNPRVAEGGRIQQAATNLPAGFYTFFHRSIGLVAVVLKGSRTFWPRAAEA